MSKKERLESVIALNAEFKYALQDSAKRIDVLEEALRLILNKRKLDATAAASMQAIARTALGPHKTWALLPLTKERKP